MLGFVKSLFTHECHNGICCSFFKPWKLRYDKCAHLTISPEDLRQVKLESNVENHIMWSVGWWDLRQDELTVAITEEIFDLTLDQH